MDTLGRLTLGEIREGSWRAIKALYPAIVDANTGEESGQAIVDRLYTKQNMDRLINESLTGRYLDLIGNSDHIFADEELVDIRKDIVEYPLPDDMAILRGLWWKDPNISLNVQPPSNRILMNLREDVHVEHGCVPTYRRQLDNFVLNSSPKQDNDGGVQVRYTKWILPLLDDGQVIESQFSLLLQEIVILESATLALSRYSNMDTTEIRSQLAPWDARLAILSRNSTSPPFVFLTVSHPLSGRAGR